MEINTKYSEFLTFLPRDDLNDLLEFMSVYSFYSGDIIIEKGQNDCFFGIIVSGRVNVLHPNEKNINERLFQLLPGMVVGEQSFFDGYPRSTTIQADSDGELLLLRKHDYDKLALSFPNVALNLVFQLAKMLSIRLRETTNIFTVSKQKLVLSQKQQCLKAKQDHLTELPNRAAYDEKILDVFHRWQLEGDGFSMALLDIDHFKRFNDEYGHLFGDEVLKKIAKLLQNSLRENDFIARLGGEEFIVIFEKTPGSTANVVANKLRKMIKITKLLHNNHESIGLTVSLGVTQVTSSDNVESIFRRVDKALYDAKNQGRDCVILR